MRNSELVNWKNKSVEERFAEVERLRIEHWKGKYDSNTRIEKVITVIKNGKIVKVIDGRKNVSSKS
ncbi:MAG: hypothetical protein ABI528_11065 [bacterium]